MENRSHEVMLLAPGFHPYFAVVQQDKAKLVVDGLSDFEAAAFDWEKNVADNPIHSRIMSQSIFLIAAF